MATESSLGFSTIKKEKKRKSCVWLFQTSILFRWLFCRVRNPTYWASGLSVLPPMGHCLTRGSQYHREEGISNGRKESMDCEENGDQEVETLI